MTTRTAAGGLKAALVLVREFAVFFVERYRSAREAREVRKLAAHLDWRDASNRRRGRRRRNGLVRR